MVRLFAGQVHLAARLFEHGLKGRTVTLKIKYHDFQIITRSKSFPEPLHDPATIAATAKDLLLLTELEGAKIRLLGITFSSDGKTAHFPTASVV